MVHEAENTTQQTISDNELLQKIYDTLDKRLQVTEEKPYNRVKVETRLIKSIQTKQELDSPSLTIENLKNVSKIKEISFIVDSVFASKGKMVINIDDVEFYTSKDLEVFELGQVQTISLDKGLRVKRDTKFDFFVWNAVDAGEVRVGVTLTYTD